MRAWHVFGCWRHRMRSMPSQLLLPAWPTSHALPDDRGLWRDGAGLIAVLLLRGLLDRRLKRGSCLLDLSARHLLAGFCYGLHAVSSRYLRLVWGPDNAILLRRVSRLRLGLY